MPIRILGGFFIEFSNISLDFDHQTISTLSSEVYLVYNLSNSLGETFSASIEVLAQDEDYRWKSHYKTIATLSLTLQSFSSRILRNGRFINFLFGLRLSGSFKNSQELDL